MQFYVKLKVITLNTNTIHDIIIKRKVHNMDIFASERQLIKNRIEELKKNKENAGINKNIVIAGGDTILKEDAEEYKSLKRMAEILEFDNRQTSRWEYLEEREKTKLVPLDSSIKDVFQNPTPLRERELRIIIGEIQGIEKTPSRTTVIASNKMSVPREELDRYNALIRMRDIINQRFKTENYYEYMELREEAGLGKLSDKEYLILVGRSNTSKKDRNRYMEDTVLNHGRMDKGTKVPELESKPNEYRLAKEDVSLPLPNERTSLRGMDLSKEDLGRQLAHDEKFLIPNIPPRENYSSDLPIVHGESALAVPDGLIESNYVYQDGYEVNWGPKVLEGEVSPISHEQSDTLKDYERNAIDVEWRAVVDEPTGSENRVEPKVEEADEELFEVEKITPWQWVKDHKKQILIALGLSALSISVIVAITQLLPALVAASEASQVAGIASEMLRNGMLHHTAIASEKLALHGANTALANMVTSLTGLTNSFSTATGVWTIGAETLPEFVVSSAANATLAAEKVAKLTSIAKVAGLGGLGSLGIGLLAPKKKSAEYKFIKKSIDGLLISQPVMTRKDQTISAQMISNKIIASTKLSDSEKNILFKKLQKALKKMKKSNKTIDNNTENNYDSVVSDINENEMRKGI